MRFWFGPHRLSRMNLLAYRVRVQQPANSRISLIAVVLGAETIPLVIRCRIQWGGRETRWHGARDDQRTRPAGARRARSGGIEGYEPDIRRPTRKAVIVVRIGRCRESRSH